MHLRPSCCLDIGISASVKGSFCVQDSRVSTRRTYTAKFNVRLKIPRIHLIEFKLFEVCHTLSKLIDGLMTRYNSIPEFIFYSRRTLLQQSIQSRKQKGHEQLHAITPERVSSLKMSTRTTQRERNSRSIRFSSTITFSDVSFTYMLLHIIEASRVACLRTKNSRCEENNLVLLFFSSDMCRCLFRIQSQPSVEGSSLIQILTLRPPTWIQIAERGNIIRNAKGGEVRKIEYGNWWIEPSVRVQEGAVVDIESTHETNRVNNVQPFAAFCRCLITVFTTFDHNDFLFVASSR